MHSESQIFKRSLQSKLCSHQIGTVEGSSNYNALKQYSTYLDQRELFEQVSMTIETVVASSKRGLTLTSPN